MTLWVKWTRHCTPKNLSQKIDNWLFQGWKWLYIGSAITYTIIYGCLAFFFLYKGFETWFSTL